MHPVYNPANAVTASRYLTLWPFVIFIANNQDQYAALTLLISALADKLDGLIAKRLGCSSAFGELFDAITDGICYAFYLCVLAYYGWVPPWIVAGIIAAGSLNVVFRYIYTRRAGRAVNYHSWAMVRAVALVAFMTGALIGRIDGVFVGHFAVPFMVIIMLYDAKRMLIDPVPE